MFASLNLQLRGDLAHFSQQLSTFPTCTESAAILVFAFESNPTERGGELELQKQALSLSFPLRRHKNELLFGPKRSFRLHGLFHFDSSRYSYASSPSRGGPGGGDNWCSYARKLEHKSVPERLEKEAVVTAERVRPEEMQRRGPSCSLAWDN